jgi:hypothetical protein
MDINLTGQTTAASQITPKLVQLKNQLDIFWPLWAKLSTEKRKWLIKNNKSPLLGLAWDIYKYLKKNFEATDYDT